MIKWTEKKINKVHETMLEILIEIDRICRKNHIGYALTGGTLLGAVRHEGFIPWDEDADVAMLRSEYRKFRKAIKKDLDRKRFFLQDHDTDPKYRWGYPKIRRRGTLYSRDGETLLGNADGIFVDILVMDNIPDNDRLRKWHKDCCVKIRGMMYSVIGRYREEDEKKRRQYEVWSRIPIGVVFFLKSMLAATVNWKRTELVGHYTLPYADDMYGVPRACFDEMIDIDFEGYTFRTYKDYDTYLRSLYKEYRYAWGDFKPHLEVQKIRFVKNRLPKLNNTITITDSDKNIPDEWKSIVTKEEGQTKKIICYGINMLELVREGGVMLKKLQKNLEVFKENSEETTLLLMPSKKVEAKQFGSAKLYRRYINLIEKFKNEAFGIYDDSCNFGRALALSDAYYGDWCKVTWYFKKYGKPVMIQNMDI